MQKNAIFIFQKINFLNYTFHTWIMIAVPFSPIQKSVFIFHFTFRNTKVRFKHSKLRPTSDIQLAI